MSAIHRELFLYKFFNINLCFAEIIKDVLIREKEGKKCLIDYAVCVNVCVMNNIYVVISL